MTTAARLEDYAVIDNHGRTIEGPFASYGDAKRRADARGGIVKFLAESSDGVSANDFDTPEAAIEHEKKAGGLGPVVVGDGVYIVYPEGMGKRLYYHSGKYHVARRAEPIEVPQPAVAADGPPTGLAIAQRNVRDVRAGRRKGTLKTAADIYYFVHPIVIKLSQEAVLVIPLDIKSRPLSPKPFIVAMGQRAEVAVDVNDIVRPAVTTNANGFVVVHQHPSGSARPSEADVKLTAAIKAREFPNQPMLDHVIIGDGEFFSFADETLYTVSKSRK